MKFNTIYFLNTLAILLTVSCNYSVENFSEEELKLTKSFDKSQTFIFISENGELDTIMFKKFNIRKETVNHVERGFYSTNHLEIPYRFTKESYHQFDLDGNRPDEQDLISIEKSSAGFGGIEICFIGLLFDEDGIKKAHKNDTNIYQFDSSFSIAKWFNVKNGIKNFTFDTEIGIVNYTDERNVKWKRK